MRAQRAYATESAMSVHPAMARGATSLRRPLQWPSATRNSAGEKADDADAPFAPPGHRFESIGVYAEPQATGGSGSDQRRLPAATAGPAHATGGHATMRRYSHPISASIRRTPGPFAARDDDWSVLRRRAPVVQGVPALRRDSQAGDVSGSGAMDIGSLLALTQQGPMEETREPQIGETIRLPDITLQQQAAMMRSDKIAGVLDYHPVINKSGVVDPGNFGQEVLRPCALSGVTVTKAPHAYAVAATVEQLITYQVRSSVGPTGEVDIASETDPDITAANYSDVADDLKPDMTQHGRPPRNKFWAEDLTIMHEQFHATEDVEFVRTAVLGAQTWLNRQTATSVAGVNTHLTAVPARITSDAQAANPAPGYEDRAYFDGSGLYQARSNAIRTKGAAGGYAASPGPAAAPASGGLSRGKKVGIGIGAGLLAGAAIGAAGGLLGLAIGAGIGAVAGLIGGLLA
jgi:hypothetical protein